MIEKKALKLFRGAEGYNCAQAVTAAFLTDTPDGEQILAGQAAMGGGRAEGGLCGALYAAIELLPSEKQDLLRQRFEEKAGSTLCKPIRKGNQLSCAGCVEEAARLTEELLNS